MEKTVCEVDPDWLRALNTDYRTNKQRTKQTIGKPSCQVCMCKYVYMYVQTHLKLIIDRSWSSCIPYGMSGEEGILATLVPSCTKW